MKHLNNETLARLVDEEPEADEAAHLATCTRCRAEREALREQTEALALLPTLRPASKGWTELEERLRVEGLLRGEGRRDTRSDAPAGGDRGSPDRVRGWGRLLAPGHQIAAGVVLLAAGVGLGMTVPSSSGGPLSSAPLPTATAEVVDDPSAFFAFLDLDRAVPELTLEEAGELVELTEAWHRAALVRYRERLEAVEGPAAQNPIHRAAALEALMAAGRVAVWEAPADPFLNGLLLNMQAERDATLRGLEARTVSENWY